MAELSENIGLVVTRIANEFNTLRGELAGVIADIPSFSAAVPVGGTSITVTHGMGTKNVSVEVWDTTTSTWRRVDVDVTLPSDNTVTLDFGVAPTSGQYRIIVLSSGTSTLVDSPWDYKIFPRVIYTGVAWPERADSIPVGYTGPVEYLSYTAGVADPTDAEENDIWTRRVA